MPIHVVQFDKPVQRPAFIVAGPRGAFDAQSMSEVPTLWQKLLGALPLAEQVGKCAYGAMWNDNGSGRINYMAGVEVKSFGGLPPGFERKAVPAQTYVVFRQMLQGGPIGPQMQAGAHEIWRVRMPKSGLEIKNGTSFELYTPGFEQGLPGAIVDIHIPIAG
jgi:AraC family transcriptional regulator